MHVSIAQRFIISTALLAGLAKTTSAQTTAASGIFIGDAKSQPESLAMSPTVLRAFEIKTGRQKLRWTLPGDKSTCNDMAIGPDKSLYITDTANGKIYKLAPGTSTP